jgi:hypothetical protein
MCAYDLVGGHRERRLIELLKQYAPSKDNLILVFALYKREVPTPSSMHHH